MEEGAEKGWYNIINVRSNRGIGMSGGTLNAGEQPIQLAVNGSADQYWRFMPIEKEGKTYYKIINKNSKLVLTMGDSKVTQETWTNKKKKLKKYSEHLTKHLRLCQRIVFKIKHSKTISSLGKFPKNQLTPNGLPAHQIKQNTKDKLSQAKAGISPLHAKPQ